MKKIIALILALAMTLAFAACGDNEDVKNTKENGGSGGTNDITTEDVGEVIVTYYDESSEKYGYCTLNAEKRIEAQFDYAETFADNNLAVVKVGKNYGYINTKGEYAIDLQFKHARKFSANGFAAVCVDSEKWGYINESGEFVIEPKFSNAFAFREDGYAQVEVRGEGINLINEKGEILLQSTEDMELLSIGQFNEKGFAITRSHYEEKFVFGYINKNGEVISKPVFLSAYNFAENGLALVKVGGEKDEKYGWINESGEFAIEPQFSDATTFGTNGLAAVCVEGKYGYINEKCEYVIAPKYEDATAFGTNGLAAVCIGGKYGYINIKEEIVIEPQFDDADEFDEMGFAGIKIGDKWGFINEKAEKIVEPRFDKVGNFQSNGYAEVMNEHSEQGEFMFRSGYAKGYVNTNGEVVVEPKYFDINNFDDRGFVEVQDFETEICRCINFEGEIIRPQESQTNSEQESDEITLEEFVRMVDGFWINMNTASYDESGAYFDFFTIQDGVFCAGWYPGAFGFEGNIVGVEKNGEQYTFEILYPVQNHFESSDDSGITEEENEIHTVEIQDGKMIFVESDVVFLRAGDEFDAEVGEATVIEYKKEQAE
ncbi:MAG: WG repeat-containing protein [Ruminococcaceae bacterium]|nr:WG repeat-containing protein [Oscillospiraceae bacterium]